MRTRGWLMLAVFGLCGNTAVDAQDSRAIMVGVRVRITAPDLDIYKYDGTVAALRGDTLTVGPVQVPLASVTRLDVHQGRKGNVGKGAMIGTLVGVPTGLALGVFYQQACSNSSDIGETCVALVPIGAVAIGLAGALVGGTVGALIKTDRWEEVPLERFRVTLAPQRNGRFALGLSVAF